MSTLEKAIQIAAQAHAGQTDKAGEPYILHPIRVMLRVQIENERIAAILHDVVEDSPVTLEDLAREGFSKEVIEAVDSLTKKKGETRIEAAHRAAANPIAKVVKLADNAENMDLSRIATDLIVFTQPELDFFKMPDEFQTGSSIMPQKKNPDVLELMRAKLHEVAGYEQSIKSCTANLISGYNRDIQITKEPLIKAFAVTLQTLQIARLLFENLEVNTDKCAAAMTAELFATEEAYRLVQSGVPFRDAY